MQWLCVSVIITYAYIITINIIIIIVISYWFIVQDSFMKFVVL